MTINLLQTKTYFEEAGGTISHDFTPDETLTPGSFSVLVIETITDIGTDLYNPWTPSTGSEIAVAASWGEVEIIEELIEVA